MTKSIWVAATGGAVAATTALALVSLAGNHYQMVSRDVPEGSGASANAVVVENKENGLTAQQAAALVSAAEPAFSLDHRQVVPRVTYADVTAVTPVKKSYSTPREVCTDQTIVYQAPVADEERVTGKLLGAVIGGVLGHQVGGGRGKDAATVGGAIIGGVLGNKVQEKQQQARTLSRIETSCKTVRERHEKIIGYDVLYRYDGEVERIRLDYQPEQRLPVEAGRITFTPYGGANMQAVTLAVSN